MQSTEDTPLLQYHASLVSAVAQAICKAMDQRTLGEVLPPERELCDFLGVSRSTLRCALARLREDGRISIQHGRRTTVVRDAPSGRRSQAKIQKKIVILSTILDRHQIQSGAFWMNDFRQVAAKLGLLVVLESLPRIGHKALKQHLLSLRDSHQPAVWVLVASDRHLHETMSELKWPVVVGGSIFPDIPFPSVDVDYRAACRHAVGQLARMGHRRVGLVIVKSNLPGDLNSIEGFEQGLASHRGEALEGVVIKVDPESASVLAALRREFRRAEPSTGLIVCRANVALSTITALASLGRKVPEDVSVIVRDYNAALLSPVWPEVTSYHCEPLGFARKILSLCRQRIAGDLPKAQQILLIPKFTPGASIAPYFVPRTTR